MGSEQEVGPEHGLAAVFSATWLCELNSEHHDNPTDVFDRLSHILLAIPSIQKSSLTVTAKFTKLGGKKEPDTKTSVQPAARTAGSDIGSDAGSARRRAAENEQSRQPIEDLV